jgi:hypothetical protein
MKGIKYLVCFLLITNTSLSQSTLLDSVINKFENDKRAFNEFRVLGRFYCLDAAIGNNDLYFQTYASIYNSFSPFTRLFDNEKVTAIFNQIILSENINLSSSKNGSIILDKGKSYYYTLDIQLRKSWDKRTIKKYYKQFVSNAENYIQVQEDILEERDINDLFKEYLKNYFIIPITDGPMPE